MPSAIQKQLFADAPGRTWKDIKSQFGRRRSVLDEVVHKVADLIPEAERRAAAARIAVPFLLDPDFPQMLGGRLLHQFCCFHADTGDRSPIEAYLERVVPDDDVAGALRDSRPALIRLSRSSLLNGFEFSDVLSGQQGLIIVPEFEPNAVDGAVVFCRLVPFPEYALPFDPFVELQPEEWSRIHDAVAHLSEETDRQMLPTESPEAFETAVIRAFSNENSKPCDSLTLRRLTYRRGIVDDLEHGRPEWIEEITIDDVPIRLADAFDFEGIGLLVGTFGDPEVGDPIEIDELDYATSAGPRSIRVYNRGTHLFAGQDPILTRLHRFFCALPDAGDIGSTVPRALNWSSVDPLYRRRRALIDSIGDGILGETDAESFGAAAARLGLNPGDDLSDQEIACLTESVLFFEPKPGYNSLEDLADREVYDEDSELCLVLDAMRDAMPAVWTVVRPIRGHGLLLEDLWWADDDAVILADEYAGLYFDEGDRFYARLAFFDGFAMTVGAPLRMNAKALRIHRDLAGTQPEMSRNLDVYADRCMEAWIAAERGARPLRPSRPSAPSVTSDKIPRNAPCPCGSGRKYKHCCRE